LLISNFVFQFVINSIFVYADEEELNWLLVPVMEERVMKSTQNQRELQSKSEQNQEASPEVTSTEESPRKKRQGKPAEKPSTFIISGPASSIEKAFRIQYSEVLLDQLKYLEHATEKGPGIIEKYFVQYGYDVFWGRSLSISGKMVVNNDYVLSCGDVLRVNMWGAGVDIQYFGAIEGDGTITLPKLGVFSIAGVRYGDVEEVIRIEATKHFQGVNISVVVVRPRSMEVYVLGQVKRPGLTMIPAFSTILTALNRAGGVIKSGTLRNIKIYRKDKLFHQLDLYDLMIHGQAKGDLLLKDKDVIYVPYIGPTIAVVGAVPQPGIFELKDNDVDVNHALALAGGVIPQAHFKLNLRRFKKQQGLQVVDIALGSSDMSKINIQNGDLLEVRYIGCRFPSTIRIEGHVWDRLEFAYHKGMTLSQILTGPDLFKPDAITDFCLIKRFHINRSDYGWIRVPLPPIWKNQCDFNLAPRDIIYILDRKVYGIRRSVFLKGAVWIPGEYKYNEELTIDDLIGLGGGLSDGGDITGVEISRQNIVHGRVVIEHILVDMTKPDQVCTLEPWDTVFIPKIKNVGIVQQVEINGHIRFPGVYTIQSGERLSSLLERAGGLLPGAYLYGSAYYSRDAQAIQQGAINNLIQQLELTMSVSDNALEFADTEEVRLINQSRQAFLARLKKIRASGRIAIKLSDDSTFARSEYDMALHDGDRIYIPDKPAFISVQGSIYSPNSYMYQAELNVEDYLNMAGGLTKTSDKDYIYIYRADGTIVSAKGMGLFSGFYETKLMPGDVIVVPEDLERVPYLRLVKDLTDIVFKIAVTAGVAANAF